VQLNTNCKGDVNQHYSDVLISNCGVPQGSILGPLLFTIFINDLASHLHQSKVILYADDTTTLSFGNKTGEVNDLARSTVADISGWCKRNNLKLNGNKTCFLNFHHKISPPVTSPLLKIDASITIQQSSSTKFLGLKLNENLDWHSHIEDLVSKMAKGIYMIRKLSSTTSLEILKLIYYAKIHSHLAYCVVLWGNSSAAAMAFSMQKRALKVMANKSIRSPGKPLFLKFNIMTLPSMYIFYCALFVKKNPTLFLPNSSVHAYLTRGSENIHILQQLCARKGPHHSASLIFNKLPMSIKHIVDINVFKTELRKFLQPKGYYSVNEFLYDKL
jgi:hypothetical protein